MNWISINTNRTSGGICQMPIKLIVHDSIASTSSLWETHIQKPNLIELFYMANWCRLIFILYMTYMTYHTNRRHPPSRWLSGNPWWTNLPKKEDAMQIHRILRLPHVWFFVFEHWKQINPKHSKFPIINKTWVFFHFGRLDVNDVT